MDGPASKSPFEIASDELYSPGIRLRRLPGEYSVNFAGGGEKTARLVETLAEALLAGRAMAAEREPARAAAKRPPRRKRRRRMMTAEARYRQRVFRHKKRVRARTARKRRRKP